MAGKEREVKNMAGVGENRKKMEVRGAQGRPESICSMPNVIVCLRKGSNKSQ